MATMDTSSPGATTRLDDASLITLYLVRGALAIVWAGVFATVSSSLTTPAIVLLILYPGIDVVASLYDARRNRGVDRIQLVNAVLSAIALVGVAVATNYDARAVLHVFGAWAIVSGLVQLAVVLRRRSELGPQWAMLVSGGVSTIAGVAFTVMAEATDPALTSLAGYAAFGGVLFVVSALLLRTDRRHMTNR